MNLYFDSLRNRSLILVRRELGRNYGAAPHQPHCRATYGLWGKGGAPSYNPEALPARLITPEGAFGGPPASPPERLPIALPPFLVRQAAFAVHHAACIKCLWNHTKPGSSTMQARLRRQPCPPMVWSWFDYAASPPGAAWACRLSYFSGRRSLPCKLGR